MKNAVPDFKIKTLKSRFPSQLFKNASIWFRYVHEMYEWPKKWWKIQQQQQQKPHAYMKYVAELSYLLYSIENVAYHVHL